MADGPVVVTPNRVGQAVVSPVEVSEGDPCGHRRAIGPASWSCQVLLVIALSEVIRTIGGDLRGDVTVASRGEGGLIPSTTGLGQLHLAGIGGVDR